MEFQALPEGCIAAILSRTTPKDVGRLSLVSKTFCSAAESDTVWDHFLKTSDSHFMSCIVSQSPLLANAPSKKALFLSHHPVIIDQGKMSFQLDRKSGKKKCYMLAARALYIIWGDTDRYWNWTSLPESRFPEVAELRKVSWIEIRGMINTLALTPNTQYAAYLVFQMINAQGFENLPVELLVGNEYGHGSTKNVCLDPNLENWPHNRVEGLPRPSVRSDGWLEIEMGEFNSGLENELVQMRVAETRDPYWKRGLILEGIEVRPKEDN